MDFKFLSKKFILFTVLLFTALFFTAFQPVNAQDIDRIERGRLKAILGNIKEQIKKNYYDSNFHGIDIEARFKKADERLDQINSVGQGFAVIAQALVDFDDSHLYFLPPATNIDVEYGFRMEIMGDKSYITTVKPKSDAEAKGLKAGDQILSFEGFNPSRKDMWKMRYYYYRLSPRNKLHLKILHPNSPEPQDMEIDAKIIQKKRIINLSDSMDVNDLIREYEDASHLDRHYFQKVGNTMIWKMGSFSFDPKQVDEIMQNYAKKGLNLIIDLRGNGGGYIRTLEAMTGYFFEKDTKIADRKGREDRKKENEPMMAKTKGKDMFPGKLVVLIDSDSASCSEIFARLIQLEKRGIVLGDKSAGAVMQAISYSGKTGTDREIYYATSITNADVIMSDGKSLEHVGVVPDELIVPGGPDLANRRDPVLARAAELLGEPISPEQAGKLFKDTEWDD